MHGSWPSQTRIFAKIQFYEKIRISKNVSGDTVKESMMIGSIVAMFLAKRA